MSPRRCLPNWSGRHLHANGGGDLAGVGLAVALLARLARALPGGPTRVLPRHTVIPVKDLAGGLVGFLGKNPAEDSCLPILIRSWLFLVFTKICMPPRRCLPSLVPMCLSSVGGLKGGSLSWCGRAALARVLPGPLRLPRQGSLSGKPTSFIRSLWPWSLSLLCLSCAFGFSPASLSCPVMHGRGGWL